MKGAHSARVALFEEALNRLEEALGRPEDAIVRDACIQRFEFTFDPSTARYPAMRGC